MNAKKATPAAKAPPTAEEVRLKRKAKFQAYQESFEKNGRSQDAYYRLFYAVSKESDVTLSMRYKMQEKARVEGSGKKKTRPLTDSEMLAAGLIEFLEREGYDTSAIRFNEYGIMNRYPKR